MKSNEENYENLMNFFNFVPQFESNFPAIKTCWKKSSFFQLFNFSKPKMFKVTYNKLPFTNLPHCLEWNESLHFTFYLYNEN